MTETKSVARKVAMIGAAALLALAAIAPAGVSATTYATVDGHQAFSAEANNPTYWGAGCVDAGDSVDGLASYTLTQGYAKVVVKAGADQYANTIFNDVAAGETVWADTNGDNTYNPGGQDGDKNISHIILCGPTATPTPTPTPTGGAGGETAATTLPPTDGLSASKGSTDGLGVVLMAVAGVLAGAMVLTPARGRRR